MDEIEQLKAEHLKLIKSLKEEHAKELEAAGKYNPEKNDKAISIIQQEDGNWTGTIKKFGKVLSARQIKPEDVLSKLLTHDGVA